MFKLASSALLVGVAVATPTAPTAPSAYTAEVTFTIPYYGTVEKVTIYNDDSISQQLVSYYDGRNMFYYDNTADGTSYEVTPIVDHTECFKSGPSEGIVVFPDLSDFTLVDGTTTVNGVECNQWTLTQSEVDDAGYIGTYNMYASVLDNSPVQFHTLGHNVVLGGSHYDEYVLDYDQVTTTAPDASVFQVADPDSCTIMEMDDDDAAPGPTFGSRHNLDLAFPSARDEKIAAFELFEKTFGKTYESAEARSERFGHFHRNLRFVNAHNLQGKRYTVGVNHLSDWTKEERHGLNGHDPSEEPLVAPEYSYTKRSASNGSGVDWREKGAVVPVGDQGTCGSCWAWGSVGAASGQQFLLHGDMTPLSAQQLMDCGWTTGNKGCEGSTASKAYSYVIQDNAGAMDTVESYPYENQNGFCRSDTAKVGATITGYVNVTYDDTFQVMNSALTEIGPLSIAIDATPDSFYFYSGGLYDDAECLNGENDLDHEVLAVGYGTTEDGEMYTIVQNSWSTHWGEDGFVRIAQAGNICGVADEPVYPLLK